MTEHGWGAWDSNWYWSLVLIALTIAFQGVAVVLISNASRLFWETPARADLSERHQTSVAIGVIVGVALSLAIAHGMEAAMWAFAYLQLGAVGTPAGAMLYSLDSLTTRGSSGFGLESRWRMMGAMESLDGMLLFGISTAFLFSVMQRKLIPPSTPHAS